MTSLERKEARYQRRKERRYQQKLKRNESATFENVASFENLRQAFYEARKTVNWKCSVQKYGCNVIENSLYLSRTLNEGSYSSKGFVEFDINERGKKRHITSVHISERVVQKSLCDNALVPVMQKSLIYDNGASQRGKGTDFARERLKTHLRQHFRKYGTNGYIILGDCHNFFGSLRHDVVEKNMRKLIADDRIIDLAMNFVNPFDEGLGLGSQVCQILAVSYQNNIDHYIKEALRVKGYARYMDDFYLICETKEEAKKYLEIIRQMYLDIGIALNEKKTQIIKLSHGFTWLQDRFFLLESGKVIEKAGKKSIARNRRKMKKLKKLLDEGEIEFRLIRMFFQSHLGYYSGKNSYYSKQNAIKLFDDLFIRSFIYEYKPSSHY